MQLADEHQVKFMETSAKSGQNVEQVSSGASHTDKPYALQEQLLTILSRGHWCKTSLLVLFLQAFIQLAKDIKNKMDKKNVSMCEKESTFDKAHCALYRVLYH